VSSPFLGVSLFGVFLVLCFFFFYQDVWFWGGWGGGGGGGGGRYVLNSARCIYYVCIHSHSLFLLSVRVFQIE